MKKIFLRDGKLWVGEPVKKARLIPLKEPENLIASQIPYPEPGLVASGIPESLIPGANWISPHGAGDDYPVVEAGIPESVETQPIPILDAKRIAENYNYNQVVIIARKVGDNGIEHVTTYGTDKANCDVAAHIGDFLRYEIMKWERKSVSPPPQESDDDLWTELGNKINKHMEPLDDAFGIHPLLDLYGKQHFTITRKP